MLYIKGESRYELPRIVLSKESRGQGSEMLKHIASQSIDHVARDITDVKSPEIAPNTAQRYNRDNRQWQKDADAFTCIQTQLKLPLSESANIGVGLKGTW